MTQSLPHAVLKVYLKFDDTHWTQKSKEKHFSSHVPIVSEEQTDWSVKSQAGSEEVSAFFSERQISAGARERGRVIETGKRRLICKRGEMKEIWAPRWGAMRESEIIYAGSYTPRHDVNVSGLSPVSCTVATAVKLSFSTCAVYDDNGERLITRKVKQWVFHFRQAKVNF